ncbi:MAG TPA: hypothetical protein VE715_18245 [Blastocatellia bacterium]|nr:hypothetical protein [Blastocatellia bacterium]
MGSSIITALIAAAVSIIGWSVIHLFTKRREDHARKAQAAIRHLERQIEEFYGPLEGLLTYADTVYRLEQTRKQLRPSEQAAGDEVVIQFFIESYYIPLNRQITELMHSKVHLMVGEKVPESYKEFMAQAATLECFHNLWRKTNLHSFFMPAPERNWSKEAHAEVAQSLFELRMKHAELIRGETGKRLTRG